MRIDISSGSIPLHASKDVMDRVARLGCTILLAPGFEEYDPSERGEYGYGRYDNVVTSIEFERLISSAGPTEGHFVRPTDLKRPQRIGFIQCVGSRTLPPSGSPATGENGRGHPYCSNICCMNTVKDSLLLLDHSLQFLQHVVIDRATAAGINLCCQAK